METQHQVHTHTFTSTNTHQQQHISAGHKHTFHSNKTPFTAQISLQVHFSPFQSFFISSSFFSSKVSHIRILNQSRQTSPGGTAAEGPWQVNGEGGVVGAPSQSPAATASWIHVVRATGPGQQSGYIYLCPLHWWTSHTTTTSQSTTALKGDAHKHSVTNTHLDYTLHFPQPQGQKNHIGCQPLPYIESLTSTEPQFLWFLAITQDKAASLTFISAFVPNSHFGSLFWHHFRTFILSLAIATSLRQLTYKYTYFFWIFCHILIPHLC